MVKTRQSLKKREFIFSAVDVVDAKASEWVLIGLERAQLRRVPAKTLMFQGNVDCKETVTVDRT